MAKTRILLIDDDRIILDMLKLGLNKPDFEVLAATDGDMGLRLFREEHPDIVVVDLAMPGMDGYDVIARMRAHEGEGTRTPIIILTAHGQNVMRTYAAELGADLYLVKPVPTSRLIEHIRELVTQRPAAKPSASD